MIRGWHESEITQKDFDIIEWIRQLKWKCIEPGACLWLQITEKNFR